MPTATPFSALGAGNGFPSCPTRIDVSGYDYWTTLSGVNKNSPTTSDALIAESFQLSMSLWWNLHRVSVETEHNGNNTGVSPASLSSVDIGNTSADPTSTLEPNERICRTFINSSDSAGGSSIFARVLQRNIKLYNGVTSNEENFVGYGAFQVNSLDAQTCFVGTQAFVFALAGVGIGGYIEDAEVDFNSFIQEFAYVELDGMHFVSMAYARDGSGRTGTVDASSISAGSIYIQNAGQPNEFETTADAAITGLDFYTY